MSNIIQWTDKTVGELLEKVKDRNGWRRVVVVVLEMIPPYDACVTALKVKVSDLVNNISYLYMYLKLDAIYYIVLYIYIIFTIFLY